MKKFSLLFLFLVVITLKAQDTRISNSVLGVNYMKSEMFGADLKMYNIHFEKQSTGSMTFGGEVFFKTGTTKQGTEFESKETKKLYFAGPSILYTNVIFGMLHYKVSANVHLGYIDYEQQNYDMVMINESLYYGFLGKVEGMAIVSLRMQFVLGAGLMKGYTKSDAVNFDVNSFYHIGLTYMF